MFYESVLSKCYCIEDLRNLFLSTKMYQIFVNYPNTEGSYQRIKFQGFLQRQGTILDLFQK